MKLNRDFKLYHVTKTRNLSNIMSKGLIPILREDSMLQKKAVYLSASPNAAAIFAVDLMEGSDVTGFNEPMSVLEITLPKDSELDFDPESFGEGFVVSKRIPPKYIKVIKVKWNNSNISESKSFYDSHYNSLRRATDKFKGGTEYNPINKRLHKEPILSIGDRKFVLKLMRTFNIRKVNIDRSDSTKTYPDIWCYPYEKPQRIVVTNEWARQVADERRKRLVHEFLHLIGYDHNEAIGYSTYPEKDTFSKKVYNSIK